MGNSECLLSAHHTGVLCQVLCRYCLMEGSKQPWYVEWMIMSPIVQMQKLRPEEVSQGA